MSANFYLRDRGNLRIGLLRLIFLCCLLSNIFACEAGTRLPPGAVSALESFKECLKSTSAKTADVARVCGAYLPLSNSRVSDVKVCLEKKNITKIDLRLWEGSVDVDYLV